ncbi:hypothetical protein Hanom_Chr02g00149351 [Helianthus anomalus]
MVRYTILLSTQEFTVYWFCSFLVYWIFKPIFRHLIIQTSRLVYRTSWWWWWWFVFIFRPQLIQRFLLFGYSNRLGWFSKRRVGTGAHQLLFDIFKLGSGPWCRSYVLC